MTKEKQLSLHDWMQANNIKDTDLANAIGCTRPYISRIRIGDVNISLLMALKIYAFTKQIVPLEQLLPAHARPDFIPLERVRGPKQKELCPHCGHEMETLLNTKGRNPLRICWKCASKDRDSEDNRNYPKE